MLSSRIGHRRSSRPPGAFVPSQLSWQFRWKPVHRGCFPTHSRLPCPNRIYLMRKNSGCCGCGGVYCGGCPFWSYRLCSLWNWNSRWPIWLFWIVICSARWRDWVAIISGRARYKCANNWGGGWIWLGFRWTSFSWLPPMMSTGGVW